MERLKALGTGARAALLAGGALIAVATGYGIWSGNQPSVPASAVADGEQASAAVPAPVPGGVTDTEIAAVPLTEPVETAAESAIAPAAEASVAQPDVQPVAAVVPTFDLVRVEPDGQALVAGQAAPGAKVVLRLDGVELSGSTADAQGNFAVLFVLDPSPVPRMLTMSSVLPGEGEITALGEVALAPTVAAPVAAVASLSTPTEAGEPESVAADVSNTLPTPEPPAALLITKDGVNVLPSDSQASTLESNADLVLDTISYTPSGEVQLAGRAAAGSVLRIYLDNAPLAEITVSNDGRWASTMPMIEPGIYTLRVDALSADGTVTGRFETPFKRETADALAAATVNEAQAAVIASAEPEPEVAPQVLAEPTTETAQVAEPEATVPPTAEIETVATPTPSVNQTQTAETPVVAEATPKRPISITVQPGFTLWGIAAEQFGDGVLYVQVFEANKAKIRDPNLIYPGQVFVIPTGSE